jgi:hypothetical protein
MMRILLKLSDDSNSLSDLNTESHGLLSSYFAMSLIWHPKVHTFYSLVFAIAKFAAYHVAKKRETNFHFGLTWGRIKEIARLRPRLFKS